MSRKNIKKLDDINERWLPCSNCGRLVQVMYDKVKSVKCEFCSIGVTDITNYSNIENLPEFDENSIDGKKVEKEKKKRGRPKGSKKNKSSYIVNKKKMVKKYDCVGKKENTVMENVGGSSCKGKRGRKATVGAALLSFMKDNGGSANVDQLQTVYNSEREKMGKKSSPEVEARNLRSTLYAQKKSGKIEEVEKNKVYRIIS